MMCFAGPIGLYLHQPGDPQLNEKARSRWRLLQCTMEYSEAAGAELIDYNGPGFYLTFFVPAPMPHNLDSHLNYDGGRRLLGIVLFWFLIGLSMDRRRNGVS
jgi:hypothetical protein